MSKKIFQTLFVVKIFLTIKVPKNTGKYDWQIEWSKLVKTRLFPNDLKHFLKIKGLFVKIEATGGQWLNN